MSVIDDLKQKAQENKSNASKVAGDAMKNLEKNAYKTTKAYLVGINSQINSVKSGFSEVKDSFGSLFMNKQQGNSLAQMVNDKLKRDVSMSMDAKDIIFGTYNVTIDGKELDAQRMKSIDTIDMDFETGKSCVCTLKVTDVMSVFIEDDIFIKDNQITVSFCLEDDAESTFTFNGYISALDIHFPETGAPVLQIHCRDLSHLMNKEKKKRSWENVTRAQVVEAIAQEYGFSCYVEPDYPFPVETSIVQKDKSDIDFLQSLAKEELDLFICNLITDKDGKTTIYYVIEGKMDEANAQEFHYHEYPYDIISFDPKINKETRREKVKTSGVNDNKEVESTEAEVPQPQAQEQEESGGQEEEDNVTYNTKTGQWE